MGGGYGPEEWIPDVTFHYDINNPTTIRRGDPPGSPWVPFPESGESLEDYVFRMKDREIEYGAAPRGAASNEFWSREAVQARIERVHEEKMERWRQKRREEQAGNHSIAMEEFFRELPVQPGLRSRDNSLSRIALWVMIHRAKKAGVVWKDLSEVRAQDLAALEPLPHSHLLHYLQELSFDPFLIEQELRITINERFWHRIVPHIHDSRLAADLRQRHREVYFCGKTE